MSDNRNDNLVELISHVRNGESDEALEEYWQTGAGRVLKDYYGTWENVPDEVVVKLLNNNMLSSFVSSVPSKFSGILNVGEVEGL